MEEVKDLETNADIPKCGGKPKPTSPPDGKGAGEWVCDNDEWVYEEEGGGV